MLGNALLIVEEAALCKRQPEAGAQSSEQTLSSKCFSPVSLCWRVGKLLVWPQHAGSGGDDLR